MPEQTKMHDLSLTQPVSPAVDAGHAAASQAQSYVGFSPSSKMSPTLQGAVQMAMPIHIRPNLTDPKLSPIRGFRTPGTDDPSGKNAEWWQSRTGRISTRLFSRGVAGSFMYAIASIVAEQALRNYDPSKSVGDIDQYGAAGTSGNGFIHRFVRLLARAFDHTLGTAIHATVKGLSGSEETAKNWITFRETARFGKEGHFGRSLGHEIVDVAFNFSAASIGDAMGRNFAQLIDPHKEISWLKGGKFDARKCLMAQGQALWKVMSYNQGEDWAVTPIYVYMMKAQRHLIDRLPGCQGFKYVFDQGNSDAYRVNKEGQVTGTYYMQNMLDYQLRFTHYNVLTLMYREMYNSVGDQINRWTKTGKIELPKAPSSVGEAATNLLKGVSDFVSYTARSFIKGHILMAFTVPFFWMIRIPQARHRALAVNPEMGPIMLSGDVTKKGIPVALKPDFRVDFQTDPGNGAPQRFTDGNVLTTYTPGAGAGGDGIFTPTQVKLPLQFHKENAPNPNLKNPFAVHDTQSNNAHSSMSWFNPYTMTPVMAPGHQLNNGIAQKFSNLIGKLSYDGSNQIADKLLYLRSTAVGNRALTGYDDVANLPSSAADVNRTLKEATTYHVNSAIAYTPYFAAKTEFAETWDKRETDDAIDRLVQGAVRLNGKELIGGMRDTWKAITKPGNTAGLGSVYGADIGTSRGWLPWHTVEMEAENPNDIARRQAAQKGMLVIDEPATVAGNAGKDGGASASHADRVAASRQSVSDRLSAIRQQHEESQGGYAKRVEKSKQDAADIAVTRT
jgi:hypothetical protein